uniref:PiggyBac transposable element-derived protein domain-containing protein n=1 Tax=Glossina palpalis gambiensis TaxID=67801 RepID=A0A1B0BSG8_9MUSC
MNIKHLDYKMLGGIVLTHMQAGDYWESFEIRENESDNEIDIEFFVGNLVQFKGRVVAFIVYNPNKPTKWGIKIFVVADSETASNKNSVTSFSKNNRLNTYTAEGCHLYTDRYYTSLPLAKELMQMKCHLTGTIQINRKGVPATINKTKIFK